MALKSKKTSPKKEPAKRRTRAKKADGTFRADDPATPDVNEAFVQTKVPDLVATDREAQRTKPSGVRSSFRRLGGKLVEI